MALFNMIPGFPLDGGRVLRALVWKISGSFHRASQIAALTGQVAAFGFIGMGLFTILGGNFFNGLWFVFIGWFLQNAAAASYVQANLQQSLRDVTVAQVMVRDCPKVSGQTALGQLVEEQVLTGARRCFFVAENGRLRGVLTLRDIAAVPRENWNRVAAKDAMVPWEHLVRVYPSTKLLTALQTMDDADVAQVPVVEENQLEGNQIVGMLSREQVLHYIRVRAEIGI